jgi:hypothetical protein
MRELVIGKVRRSRELALAAGLGCALGLAAVGASAQEPPPAAEQVRWDQARLTQYATELSDAVKRLRQEVRKVPSGNNLVERRSRAELLEDLRLIDNSASHLRSALVKGEGREETYATFKRIGTLRNDAAENARKSLLPAPMMDALVKAGEIHNRMFPYYEGKR